jgi:predicted polyphosphate/ATP-dependent NAD kinase
LIVNPIAGMGGSVALKGTDGVAAEALRRGARAAAPERAARALTSLRTALPAARLRVCAGAMGDDAARIAGLTPETVLPVGEPTSAADTRDAAAAMIALGIDLLVFAGGDGTAADVYAAVDGRVPVVGVPAGVKMHSAVFARTPEAAGKVAAQFLTDPAGAVVSREVLDVDEQLLRTGVLAPRLVGHLDVPRAGALTQHPKLRGAAAVDLPALGRAVLGELPPGALCAVGPGTTAGAVMVALGLPHTPLGFDLIRDGALVGSDVGADELLQNSDELHVVLAPTGGQGALLGRGNQQLTPAVLRRLSRERLHVVATRERLARLQGRPLLIDLDDPELAARLAGVHRILVGPAQVVYYPAEAPDLQPATGDNSTGAV